MTANAATKLQRLDSQCAVRLTTFRRNGAAVGTGVNIAVEGDHAYVRSFAKSGKVKRVRLDSHVEVAPSTASGKATGPSIGARARLLEGEEASHASELLERKHRIVHGILVPLAHKLQGHQTVHMELTPEPS